MPTHPTNEQMKLMPLPTSEAPTDRAWTDIEWVRNQWWMAQRDELSESRAQVARLLVDRNKAIAGALYDLMGWLTTRRTRLVLSDKDLSGPAVDALIDWAKMREFSLDNADVSGWQTSALPEQSARDAAEKLVALELRDDPHLSNCDWTAAIQSLCQAVRGDKLWQKVNTSE